MTLQQIKAGVFMGTIFGVIMAIYMKPIWRTILEGDEDWVMKSTLGLQFSEFPYMPHPSLLLLLSHLWRRHVV